MNPYSQSNAFTKPRRRSSLAATLGVLALVVTAWAVSGVVRGVSQAQADYPVNEELGAR